MLGGGEAPAQLRACSQAGPLRPRESRASVKQETDSDSLRPRQTGADRREGELNTGAARLPVSAGLRRHQAETAGPAREGGGGGSCRRNTLIFCSAWKTQTTGGQSSGHGLP